MKKILKSILIATATVGTLAGTTTAVVSCGEKAPENGNQNKYDTAIKSLKNKIGDGSILGNFKIVEGGSSIPEKLQKLEIQIQDSINKMITSDSSIKDILGAAAVTFTGNNFDTASASSTVKVATGINLSIASDLSDVKVPTPWGINVKYIVISTAQENYDNSVSQILSTLSNLAAEANNTFLMEETADQVKQYLFDLINSAIPAGDKFVAKFTASAEILGLAAAATAIQAEFSKGEQTGKTILIDNITFLPKGASITTNPQSFMFHYSITQNPQKKYQLQLASLISKFTTTGDGSIAINITNSSNAITAVADITAQIKQVITNGGSVYNLLDGNDITITGITDNEFQFTPGDHSNPVNTLTSAVTIKIGTTSKSTVTPPATGTAFHFYYVIIPSKPDTNAYQTAINKIIQHYTDGARTINFIADTSPGDAWENSVTIAIQKDVSDYISQNNDLSSVINAGTAGANIAVDIAAGNFVSDVGSGTMKASPQLSITMQPKWNGIVAVEKDFGFTYKVLPNNSFFNQGIATVQQHFNDLANKITMHRLGKEGANTLIPQTYIINAINDYMSKMTDNNQKAAMGTVTVDTVPASISLSTLHAVGTTPTAITVTFNPSAAAIEAGVVAKQVTTFNIYWEVLPNDNDLSAEKVLQQVIMGVVSDSALKYRPVKLLVKQRESAAQVTADIKNLILNKMATTPAAADWFDQDDASAIISGVTAASFDSNTLVDDGVISSSTTITATLTVNSTKAPTTMVVPISLAGLHYKVYETDQDVYSYQAGAALIGVQNALTTLPLRLNTNSNYIDIQTAIKTYINTYLDALPASQRTHLADIVNLGAISIDETKFNLKNADSSIQTATGTGIMIPPNSAYPGVSAKPIALQISYTVSAPSQGIYDAAVQAVYTHFTTVPLFTAGYDVSRGEIPGLIQKSIYDFITTYSGPGALTAAQKASFSFVNTTDIRISPISDTLLLTEGTHHIITSYNINITIPAAAGAVTPSTGRDYTGATYVITPKSDQTNYNEAIQKISDAITASSTAPISPTAKWVHNWNINPQYQEGRPDGIALQNYTPEQLAQAIRGTGSVENGYFSYIETNYTPILLAFWSAQRLGYVDPANYTLTITGDPGSTNFTTVGPWNFVIHLTIQPAKAGVTPVTIDIPTNVVNTPPPSL